MKAIRANERVASRMDEKAAKADRKLFVRFLGELLSMTRMGVISAKLDDDEIVTVMYEDGSARKVNVEADSYIAIIRDVVKRV